MRFNKIAPLVFTLLILKCYAFAQDKYCIFFTDKKNVSYNPYEYLDKKAIERRIKHGISLYDSTDFPLNQQYVESVYHIADSVLIQSRWFNAVIVYASENKIEKIKNLSFVKNIELLPEYKSISASIDFDSGLSESEYEKLKNQTAGFQPEKFWDNNINGKGVRIAVFDLGFPTVDVSPAFEHIRKQNHIIKTYDFVKRKDNVYANGTHGTMVLSCIAGMVGEKKIGLATEAEFLLARTEYTTREPYSEEQNWLAAAEWADKNGADIINSSVGYSDCRYFVKDMTGKSFVARAANMAARKGILVINAAGNEGAGEWKTIITPADADSVLTIGAIDPTTNIRASFSSFGPTYDKRLKPNICAAGLVIVAAPTGLIESQGTSFSSPLVAGFAACALQCKPQLKAMELFSEIEKSGNLYPYYDYAHGYGVPQASYFIGDTKIKNIECPFEITRTDMAIEIKFKKMYIENELNTSNGLLYYHIENPEGYLYRYAVVSVYSEIPAEFSISNYKPGSTIRVRFDKWVQTFKIN